MKILAIETSCDETGIAILEHAAGDTITLLGNALASQIELHAQYGGVFPAMAKRAHAEKFTVLLQEALEQAGLLEKADLVLNPAQIQALEILTEREQFMKDALTTFFSSYQKPDIGYIAVTVGPGLEPALWVGVNAARVLSLVWDIPVIPINHMEGHIVASALQAVGSPARPPAGQPASREGLAGREQAWEKSEVESKAQKRYKFKDLQFPVLALLISGGHTELVVAESFGKYQKIGQTRDDAVGEAFDKVARMLGLPYPGGPAISALAAAFRSKLTTKDYLLKTLFTLPRPMLHSPDYDFSFSGIKTATLYAIRDVTGSNSRELENTEKEMLAAAFEDAVVEVLIKKTVRAAQEYHTPTIIVGGGVSGNTYLRDQFLRQDLKNKLGAQLLISVYFPEPWLATDNAVMIGMAAMAQVISGKIKTAAPENLKADGNLSL